VDAPVFAGNRKTKQNRDQEYFYIDVGCEEIS